MRAEQPAARPAGCSVRVPGGGPRAAPDWGVERGGEPRDVLPQMCIRRAPWAARVLMGFYPICWAFYMGNRG
jgi:hypothetical protein